MIGRITGTIVSLEPEKRIVQEWRMKDWPLGHYSLVTIEIVTKVGFRKNVVYSRD